MAATRPGTTCIDFEGLPDPPAEYTVGQSIPLGAITANVASFHQEDGSLFDGRCRASTYGYTDGSGKELAIFGVNVEFPFSPPASAVSLKFSESSAFNLNIAVNGSFQFVDRFCNVPAGGIGGVGIVVTPANPECRKGLLELTGTIDSLAIGGLELWIDDVCFT